MDKQRAGLRTDPGKVGRPVAVDVKGVVRRAFGAVDIGEGGGVDHRIGRDIAKHPDDRISVCDVELGPGQAHHVDARWLDRLFQGAPQLAA